MRDEGMIEISPAEFAARRAAGELWQLLDVREHWEVETAAITDSIHVPMAEVPQRVAELDLEAPIAVMCHGGVRSAHVARWLVASGASTVANLTGGIDAWSVTVDSTVPRY